MTLLSPYARILKDKLLGKKKRNFTPEETLQLQEMQRAFNARKFELEQIKLNTALIPRGQEIVKELEAILSVLENAKNYWVMKTFENCGYPNGTKCAVNLMTGKITLTP